MNVLVYSGLDAAVAPLGHTFASLRSLLAPNYAVQPIDQKVLSTQPWHTSCVLLVFPPFLPSSVAGLFTLAAREAIQKYVVGGGRFLALGVGVCVVSTRRRGVAVTMELSAPPSSSSISARDAEVSLTGKKLTLEDGQKTGSCSSSFRAGS